MQIDLDGTLIDAHEARVSPFDGGYLYGDGLFDTLRSYRGFAFALDEHLARLRREAELLLIPFNDSFVHWSGRIERVLRANELMDQDARIRIQISRGGGPDTDHISADPDTLDPVTHIQARAVSDGVSRDQGQGVRVLVMQNTFARGNFPQIKSLNYLPSIMALRFARAQGYDEAVLLNRQNRLLEGATSNVFLLQGHTLRTPSPRLGLLPGITRNKVMRLAAEMGLKVEEAASELRDLLVADEVFITGSVKEVVPVVAVDQGAVADGQPGPWTRKLQVAYRDSIEAARKSGVAEA